jgi:catechol 2,3-dioxygenase-like lactoylglutathione lyase family enzyme
VEIKLLEHINIRTTDMLRLEEWYTRILGLKKGYRPPFGVKGVWMYAGDVPMVHLLEVNETSSMTDPRMEHFCMRALGLKEFLQTLNENKIEYRTQRVPELRILQVYISDPEDNHMHIDFPPEEGDILGFD